MYMIFGAQCYCYKALSTKVKFLRIGLQRVASRHLEAKEQRGFILRLLDIFEIAYDACQWRSS